MEGVEVVRGVAGRSQQVDEGRRDVRAAYREPDLLQRQRVTSPALPTSSTRPPAPTRSANPSIAVTIEGGSSRVTAA